MRGSVVAHASPANWLLGFTLLERTHGRNFFAVALDGLIGTRYEGGALLDGFVDDHWQGITRGRRRHGEYTDGLHGNLRLFRDAPVFEERGGGWNIPPYEDYKLRERGMVPCWRSRAVALGRAGALY